MIFKVLKIKIFFKVLKVLTLILETIFAETNHLWGSSFVSKFPIFYVDLENSEEK